MSCFRLSKKFCKKLTSVVARFWWGGDEKKRCMHWRKWIDIAIPKSEGGMGFKDFELFNQAMLAKQGWRLMTKPASLCARVLKGRYFFFREPVGGLRVSLLSFQGEGYNKPPLGEHTPRPAPLRGAAPTAEIHVTLASTYRLPIASTHL